KIPSPSSSKQSPKPLASKQPTFLASKTLLSVPILESVAIDFLPVEISCKKCSNTDDEMKLLTSMIERSIKNEISRSKRWGESRVYLVKYLIKPKISFFEYTRMEKKNLEGSTYSVYGAKVMVEFEIRNQNGRLVKYLPFKHGYSLLGSRQKNLEDALASAIKSLERSMKGFTNSIAPVQAKLTSEINAQSGKVKYFDVEASQLKQRSLFLIGEKKELKLDSGGNLPYLLETIGECQIGKISENGTAQCEIYKGKADINKMIKQGAELVLISK
ncbi:MAG: hypothetical protein AAFY76_05810, partial [Cyanobacteria bacterium J06649_11]